MQFILRRSIVEVRAMWWRYAAVAIALTLPSCLVRVPHDVPSKNRLTVVIVGDSIAAALTAGRADATLVYRLASLRPQWFIVNYSVLGAAMGSSEARNGLSAGGIVPLWARVVVIMLGANDFGYGVPLERFREQYGEFIDGLRGYYSPAIICVTPLMEGIESQPNRIGVTMQAYRDAIRDVCDARGAGVVDGRRLLPYDGRYFADFPRVHPNADGYARMSRNLAAELDSHIPAQ